MNPSYRTGHGAVAGTCITVLKFFFDRRAKVVDILAQQSRPPKALQVPTTIQHRPDWDDTQTVYLEISRFFEPESPVISRELVQPGDLTQSLCSRWQNDYRECACYYWAASRPDYVDIEDGSDGLSAGYNWTDRNRGAGPRARLLARSAAPQTNRPDVDHLRPALS
jgi:hypothetical protein